MAVVEIPRTENNFSLRNFGTVRRDNEIMAEVDTVVAASPTFKAAVPVMFVALGKDVKESETVLNWALHHSGGMRICILHVHQLAQKIPMMGTKVSISLMEEHQVKAYHENERREMHKILDKYIRRCDQAGVQAEKLWTETDSIEKGLVQLISEHCIKWLAMGAAANRSYSRKMKELKSKKAIHVCTGAPIFCHIWFICKGNLIYTRQSEIGGVNTEGQSPPFQASHNTEAAPSLRSHSTAESEKDQMKIQRSALDYHMISSDNHKMRHLAPSSGSGGLSPRSLLSPKGTFDWNSLPKRSSVGSLFSTCSSEITEQSATVPDSTEGNKLPMFQQNLVVSDYLSLASKEIEENMHDVLYDRLEQFMVEVESSDREAYEESVKRKKAEKDIIIALRRIRASETIYAEEQRHRREIEETLAKSREEAENMKWQLDQMMGDFRVAEEQKLTLEHQISESDKMVEELEQKMFSAIELLQKYKKERDELQVECDNALKLADELKEKQAGEASSSSTSQFFSEFSFLEIKVATNNFEESLKIGEGGYGSIHRGNLRHTQVAIKMLHPNSSQGPLEFQSEVNTLSKLRHPNIVNLIGACPEAWALIYEYLPNGSLEDRLNCRNNTPPLSWKTRIRIAAELCSALIFLHSCRPQRIVHGDLKPANILLDTNFVCKLGDFGICRQLLQDSFSENNTTLCCRTDPKGTLVYMDPEFLTSGELTSKSDVYSFGIILLRLLTGRPALGITKEVQYALDKGNLKDLLDATAGDWPFVQAKQLAHLALNCSDMNRKARPDLASEVWRVLEPMKVSCGVSSLRFDSKQSCRIPPYFVCPIFQEIMQEPVVAADGFTYESEALKGWLDSGHDTSPMTNLKLPHNNLLPNHALRSAIQEWLQIP